MNSNNRIAAALYSLGT